MKRAKLIYNLSTSRKNFPVYQSPPGQLFLFILSSFAYLLLFFRRFSDVWLFPFSSSVYSSVTKLSLSSAITASSPFSPGRREHWFWPPQLHLATLLQTHALVRGQNWARWTTFSPEVHTVCEDTDRIWDIIFPLSTAIICLHLKKNLGQTHLSENSVLHPEEWRWIEK